MRGRPYTTPAASRRLPARARPYLTQPEQVLRIPAVTSAHVAPAQRRPEGLASRRHHARAPPSGTKSFRAQGRGPTNPAPPASIRPDLPQSPWAPPRENKETLDAAPTSPAEERACRDWSEMVLGA